MVALRPIYRTERAQTPGPIWSAESRAPTAFSVPLPAACAGSGTKKPAPFFFAATVPQRYETCGFDPAEGPDPNCVTGMTGPPQWVWTTLLVVTLAAALYTAWRLNRRIREAA